ncbi:MAG: hypothetical protein LQ341_005176 [Variospora aurantia]|nr:MAG: hypothetical protein LQ341_005176 [Variospora aurantia]
MSGPQWGVGDVLALTKLAWDLYHNCYLVAKDAPEDFRLTVNGLASFQAVLRTLRDDENSGSSFLERLNDDRKKMPERQVAEADHQRNSVLRSNLTPPASNDEVFEPSGGFPKVALANLERRSTFSDKLDMKPPPPSPLLSEASSELKRQPRGELQLLGKRQNIWAKIALAEHKKDQFARPLRIISEDPLHMADDLSKKRFQQLADDELRIYQGIDESFSRFQPPKVGGKALMEQNINICELLQPEEESLDKDRLLARLDNHAVDESQPKVSISNQSGTISMTKDFTPDDLQGDIAPTSPTPGDCENKEGIQLNYGRMNVPVTFTDPEDQQGFMNLPRSYFNAVKSSSGHAIFESLTPPARRVGEQFTGWWKSADVTDFENILKLFTPPVLSWSNGPDSGYIYNLFDSEPRKNYEGILVSHTRLKRKYNELFYMYRDTDYVYSRTHAYVQLALIRYT